MQELQHHVRTEQHIEQQQPVKLQFLGSFKPHAGHTCFELNLETKRIEPAIFETETLEVTGNKTYKTNTRRKLIVKPNCLYATALNVKNAEKKFVQMIKAL